MLELREVSLAILVDTDVQAKVSRLHCLFDEYQQQRITLDLSVNYSFEKSTLPGRPQKPDLVPPLQVPKRRMDTVEGRASLLHSLAHIEFNAMNLALDAIWRFPDMPTQYYEDWLRVAKEEISE